MWCCFEWGLHGRTVSCAPVSSYLAVSPLPEKSGGLLSVALSLKSPSPDVIRHPCPVKPGLSSDAASRQCARNHPAHSYFILFTKFLFLRRGAYILPRQSKNRRKLSAYARRCRIFPCRIPQCSQHFLPSCKTFLPLP